MPPAKLHHKPCSPPSLIPQKGPPESATVSPVNVPMQKVVPNCLAGLEFEFSLAGYILSNCVAVDVTSLGIRWKGWGEFLLVNDVVCQLHHYMRAGGVRVFSG